MVQACLIYPGKETSISLAFHQTTTTTASNLFSMAYISLCLSPRGKDNQLSHRGNAESKSQRMREMQTESERAGDNTSRMLNNNGQLKSVGPRIDSPQTS